MSGLFSGSLPKTCRDSGRVPHLVSPIKLGLVIGAKKTIHNTKIRTLSKTSWRVCSNKTCCCRGVGKRRKEVHRRNLP